MIAAAADNATYDATSDASSTDVDAAVYANVAKADCRQLLLL